jgi:O-antigen ligase
MTLCLLKTANTSGKKIFLWSGLLLMFLNIYKTSSRGPWLGLTISLGILLVCEHGRVRRYLAAIAVLTVAVLVIRPGVWDTIANIYVATFDPQSPLGSSFEYRYVLRDLAVKAVSKTTERSLWGYGMESFYYLKLEGQLYGRPYKFLSCDSAWLELLVETGYAGLLIVASLLFLPLWRAWKDMRRGAYPIQVYFVSAMIGYYFMMMSAALYGWGQTGYILWMIIAMSFAYRGLRKTVERAPLVKLVEINTESTLSLRGPLLDYGS